MVVCKSRVSASSGAKASSTQHDCVPELEDPKPEPYTLNPQLSPKP